MNVSNEKTLLCYFGHHKCASTWIISVFYDVCAVLGLVPYEKQIVFLDDPFSALTEKNADFYFCQTSDYSKVVALPNFKGFHVIRDPRDIIVSGYYSHLYSHATKDWPELAAHREKLKAVDKTEGLLLEVEFSKQFIEHIGTWNYKTHNILEIKFEDLVENPRDQLKRIFSFLNLYESQGLLFLHNFSFKVNRILSKVGLKSQARKVKLNDDFIDEIMKKYSFEKLSGGRDRGVTDEFSHYRRGIPGDWKNHFQDVHKEKFKEIYGDIVVKLGYEEDNHW